MFAKTQVDRQWSIAAGEQVSMGIVQPNTPINSKWQPQYRQTLMQNLVGKSAELINRSELKPELIIWPETALPLHIQQADDEFWHSLKHAEVGLLTGLVDSPNFEQSYNAAILLCGDTKQVYRKRHLVPFGEYLPLRFLFNWVLEYLELPMSDLASWQGDQALQCGEQIKIGLSICYEDSFADEMRRYSGDATVLVNISEDAWFGDSFAPHQRLQMAQMRARELARPMLRSANSGPSAVINERGEVVAKTGQFKTASLVETIQPLSGDTLYKRAGNWVIWLACAVLLILATRMLRIQARR